ncbi:hypothetical protein BDF14DRAFT_1866086 [Spinellus fusiger]|nr:hypothetical protein BDF14DRAFT_1866086 [Spinellus fusiger]
MSKVKCTAEQQSLFQQFAPTLLFDAPRLSPTETSTETSELWYTVSEQTVPANRHAFWHTVRSWTEQPNYAIPPIEKAEINRVSVHEGHASAVLGTPFETIQRTLIPKRKSKDAPLVEKIDYEEQEKKEGYEARVTYQPVMHGTVDTEEPNSIGLPFYYPKVKAYRFVYTCSLLEECDGVFTDPEEGILQLQIMPWGEQAAITDHKMQYALKTLFHKLFKWCIQSRFGYKKHSHHDVLVPKEEYMAMYQHIKSTYAQALVNHWTEKTDPKKFVYEDIAIASYLICLWKKEEEQLKRKPTFVDLGCGNGLLTHLLTSQGYKGCGVDMASRKIWSSLCEGQTEALRVKTLYPAQESYPDADWLLGNHADELVPWIPVMAAKSSPHCNFLVIPCCFYALDGTRTLPLGKMAEEEGGKYKAYCKYIQTIATQCGFDCDQEELRIPSTRNTAIVGRHRRHYPSLEDLESITAFAQTAFVPRKSDREKEELRRLKRSKTE